MDRVDALHSVTGGSRRQRSRANSYASSVDSSTEVHLVVHSSRDLSGAWGDGGGGGKRAAAQQRKGASKHSDAGATPTTAMGDERRVQMRLDRNEVREVPANAEEEEASFEYARFSLRFRNAKLEREYTRFYYKMRLRTARMMYTLALFASVFLVLFFRALDESTLTVVVFSLVSAGCVMLTLTESYRRRMDQAALATAVSLCVWITTHNTTVFLPDGAAGVPWILVDSLSITATLPFLVGLLPHHYIALIVVYVVVLTGTGYTELGATVWPLVGIVLPFAVFSSVVIYNNARRDRMAFLMIRRLRKENISIKMKAQDPPELGGWLSKFGIGTSRPNVPQSRLWEVDPSEVVVDKAIGVGAFGEVFKATWRGTTVAVKKLRRTDISESVLKEFRDELEVMVDLRHPNVLLLMGASVEPPDLLLIMEFMDRGDLHSVLHDERIDMLPSLQLSICQQIAGGVNYLHHADPPILHRDLKTLNVLVDAKWNVKVSDFGMSLIKDGLTANSAPGTIPYSAPEVLEGSVYTEKADVYSFGIILWEIMSRDIPYKLMAHMTIGYQVVAEDLRPTIPKGLDEGMVDLIKRCWARDAETRPDFGAVVKELDGMTKVMGTFSSPMNSVRSSGRKFVDVEPPTGWVAMVFSDIVNSSAIWEADPSLMRRAVKLHNTCVRQQFRRLSGYEVKMEGDAFLVVFEQPINALRYTLRLQEALLNLPWDEDLLDRPDCVPVHGKDGGLVFRGPKVRLGIHFGQPEYDLDEVTERMDYFGPPLLKAARVQQLAHGGHILVSNAFWKAVQGQLDTVAPAPLVREIGNRGLKSLGPSENLRIVLPASLGQRLPAEGNKPYPMSRLPTNPNILAMRGPQRASDVNVFNAVAEEGAGATTAAAAESEEERTSSEEEQAQLQAVASAGAEPQSEPGLEESLMSIGGMQLDVVEFLIAKGDIEMQERVGVGTFGEVYAGMYKGERVAVKKLLRHFLNEDVMLDLYEEVFIISQLKHDNVVRFIGACASPIEPFMVTEFLPHNLEQFLAGDVRAEPASMDEKLGWVADMVRGMAYLHGRNIVHRDIKSPNLMISADGVLKITDFGLARVKLANQTMTKCGTVAWTAPEVLRGDRYSEKCDVYSAGVVMWEMLTHVRPFDDWTNVMELVNLILNGTRPPIPASCPFGPFVVLMKTCWRANPSERPSFEQLQVEIASMIAQSKREGWGQDPWVPGTDAEPRPPTGDAAQPPRPSELNKRAWGSTREVPSNA